MSSKLPFISSPIRSARSIPSTPNTSKHFEYKTVNGLKVMCLVDNDKHEASGECLQQPPSSDNSKSK